jgi:hypothetical protein
MPSSETWPVAFAWKASPLSVSPALCDSSRAAVTADASSGGVSASPGQISVRRVPSGSSP